ncbi:MAG: VWA domain-containing protein [Planctomycetota bacterium]
MIALAETALGFDWLRPGAAWFLALALLPALIGLRRLSRTQRALRLLCEPRHLHRLFPTLKAPRHARGEGILRWLRRRALLRAGLAALAALFFAAAYVGPVRGYALVPAATRRIDVVVVLDTSRSMWVEDVAPSRLGRAKNEIVALLDAMRGERAGLIAFAGLARSVAPLTQDMRTVRYFVERLSPNDNRKGGTDIGGALRLALERFEAADGGGTQAIVLVTDGEDLTGEGLAAAGEAKERGIRVHVLGMGTEAGGKIPDGEGGFVVDPDTREEVVSRLESSSLEAITDATDGIYLEAKGRVLPLEELYARAIQPMEGRNVVDGKERVPRDRYQWLLVLGVACALLSAALVDSRRRPRRRAPGGGRGEEERGDDGRAVGDTRGGKGAAEQAAVLLVLAVGVLGCADDGDAEVFTGTAREAVRAMEKSLDAGAHAEAIDVANRALEPTRAARLRARLDDLTRGASESLLTPLGAVLDAVGVASLQPLERGQIELARGLVHADWATVPPDPGAAPDPDGEAGDGAEERLAAARRAFVRAVGAHAALRPAALEALGDVDLLVGEALRAALPEVQGTAGLPSPPGGGGGDDENADLEAARAAYLAARGRYVECFAAGDASGDARANSELCVRRLEELDRIEQQREEQDEQQQDSESDQESDDSESEESEDDSEEKDEPNEREQDPESGEDSEERDPEEPDPDEQPPEDEPEDPEEQPEDPESGEDESDTKDSPEEEPAPEDAPAEAPESIEEKRMTLEELERLLDRNREYQELGEERRRQVARQRRIPTQRDW